MPDADAPVATQARMSPRTPPPSAEIAPVRRLHAVPVLVTLIALALAGAATWAVWQAYMTAPWTRDGTVRAYVINIAPEVSGRVVQLPVTDNQFVHKGDMLISIDPTDYAIAVDLAQAAADQASANADNAQREAERRSKLSSLEASEEEKQTFRIYRACDDGGVAPSGRQSGTGAGESATRDNPVASQRLRNESIGPGWRLRNCPAEYHFSR